MPARRPEPLAPLPTATGVAVHVVRSPSPAVQGEARLRARPNAPLQPVTMVTLHERARKDPDSGPLCSLPCRRRARSLVLATRNEQDPEKAICYPYSPPLQEELLYAS